MASTGSNTPPWRYPSNLPNAAAFVGRELPIPPGQPVPTFADDINKRTAVSDHIKKRHSSSSGHYGQRTQSPDNRLRPTNSNNAPPSPTYSAFPALVRTNSSPGSAPPSRKLPRPPVPPMTKSNQKILQLTGFNPRIDSPSQKSQADDEPPSPVSSWSSSGSHYDDEPQPFTTVALSPQPHSPQYLKSSIYSASASSNDSVHTKASKTSSNVPQARTPLSREPSARTKQSYFNNENASLPAFARPPTRNNQYDFEPVTPEEKARSDIEAAIAQERARFESFIPTDKGSKYRAPSTPTEEKDFRNLMPPPLTLRPKHSRQSRFSEDEDDAVLRPPSSIFANARDSMAWGLRELTEPHLKKTPPPALKVKTKTKRKRDLASEGHPMKSPYPLLTPSLGQKRESASVESFKDKVSGAFRKFSSRGGSVGVISNAARKGGGPSTPHPGGEGRNPGFMGMGSPIEKTQRGFENVVGRVKGNSRSDKRREELKSKIVVVGITDQSPDGRISEWL